MKEKILKGLDAEMPNKAHLLLYTDVHGKTATGIPPGAMMGVMVRINSRDVLHRLLLVEVSREKLTFRCTCHPKCKMVFEYKLTRKGEHPPETRALD